MARALLCGAALMLVALFGSARSSIASPIDDSCTIEQGSRPCPPRFQRDRAAADAAIQAKKARMRARGFPERLLALLDREECVGCVEMAPDTFTIVIEYDRDHAPTDSSGKKWLSRSFEWHPLTEAALYKDKADGRLKSFYIVNAMHACECCDSQDYDRRADWNKTLEMNMNNAIVFDGPEDVRALPPDLKEPPREWLQREPESKRYEKPGQKVAHAPCLACEPLVVRLNEIYSQIDIFWDEKIRWLNAVSDTRIQIVRARNQITRLGYQQQFQPAPAIAGELAAAQRTLADLQATLAAEQQKVAAAEQGVRDYEAKAAQQIAEINKCAEKCRTTTSTSVPQQVAAQAPQAPRPTPNAPLINIDDVANFETFVPPPTADGGPGITIGTSRAPETTQFDRYRTDSMSYFILVGPGPYTAQLEVVNTCDWAQSVRFSRFSANGPWTEATVPGKGNIVVGIEIRQGEKAVIRPGEKSVQETIPVWVQHDEATQGDKFCLESKYAAGWYIFWTPKLESSLLGGGAGALQPYTWTLQQKGETTPETPGTTTTTTPGTPEEPAATTGLEFPAIPVPGAGVTPPEPEAAKDPETGSGGFIVRPNGRYQMGLVVENECDWDQAVFLKYGDPSTSVQRTETVPARRSERFLLEVPPGIKAFWITALHAEATRGDKTCAQKSIDVTIGFSWTATAPTRDSGLVGPPGNLVLTQSETDTPAPETPASFTPPTSPVTPDPDDCGAATDCIPLDECTGAGTCGDMPAPGGIDDPFQVLGAETIRVRINVSTQPPRNDMNPLGLLSKSFKEFMNWWMPALEAADVGGQGGLQKGLQFLITSAGGSTGKNLSMQVLNFTGKPVNLQGMIALEPLKKDAQQRATQAFAKLAGGQIPTKVDLNAYCLEFLKLPPLAGQVMRVAGPEVQKRFAPMKKIMAAANQLTARGALKPDGNPAAYADSIKQWAIWTAEQKFNDKKFADAFLSHTKKNLEGAGQKWTKQIEDVVKQRTPNRWQDIVQILRAAGAPVPQ